MSIFRNREKRIVKIVKKAMPAVISISASKGGKEKDSGGFISGGSGFIVRENGIILTNRHVIADPQAEYEVTLGSGKKFKAELLARDPVQDIAILKIEAGKEKFPIVPLGDSRNIKLGQRVLALGNVLGLFKNTVSAGIISGLSRSITAQIDKGSEPSEIRGLIQTDAAINPGNSGGPLVNLSGKAIGINIATIAELENVGFALPIEIVERDLGELKKHGRICRPLLGVRYLTVDERISEKLNLPVSYGTLIIKDHLDKAVVKGSPADKARLKEGDIILEWNGEKITSDKNIQDYLSRSEVGDKVEIKILRDKDEIKKNITLAERK